MQIWQGEGLIDTPQVRQYLFERIQVEPALRDFSAVKYHKTGTMGVCFAGSWGSAQTPVVLKLNASPTELEWMTAVAGRTADVVPSVYASGTTLDSAEVGWLLLADTPHHFNSASIDDCRKLMVAAARFQQVAATIDGTTEGIDREFFDQFLPQAIKADCPGPGTTVFNRMPTDLEWLNTNHPPVRCHGDVHFANALSADPDSQLLLIDPIPRTAHWAWDAAYAQMICGVPATPPLVPLLAHAREQLGLPAATATALGRIETILLGWSSMLWWAIIAYRRTDTWWAQQVEHHVRRLANLNRP